MDSKTADRILGEASALIFEKGWIQGSYKEDDGFCVQGALRHAAFGAGFWDNIPVYDTVNTVSYYAACARLMVHTDGNIIIWNDALGRTVEDVTLAFKKALHETDGRMPSGGREDSLGNTRDACSDIPSL